MEVQKRGNSFHITWKNRSLPLSAYNKLRYKIIRSNDYSAIPQPNKYLHKLAADLGKNITPGQVLAVRNIIIKDKIIRNYNRMNIVIDEVAHYYMDGLGIVKLSQLYDFPPLNLLRGIFLYRGAIPTDVYNLFVGKASPQELLKGRDLSQYRIASNNDAESTFNRRQVADVALSNEKKVIEYLRSVGISLKDERQLIAEQVESHGRAMLTPDVLFLDEVYINGMRVHWFDYKDYIGTSVPFLYESNCAQANKYNEKWGAGCLCYRHSFIEGLNITGTLLVDARALPIELV